MFRNKELFDRQKNLGIDKMVKMWDWLNIDRKTRYVMEELNRMIRKMKVENLTRYLMYDVETDAEETVDYEQDLKESYEIFFQKLEDMYPEASRQDDELFRLVTDFAVKHENISFKAGMFIGFQIYKNMEEGYRGHTADSLSALASFLKEEIADKEVSLEK